LVGWRGMVGSVLLDRMQAEGDFDLIEPLFFSTSNSGGAAPATLASARRAVDAIAATPGTITPFPGGVVRSGSKVGSHYEALRASTNEAFCPSLVGRVETGLVAGATCSLEIVIDGVDEITVATAMAAGIRAAVGPEIVAISAGNYGGKLGKFHFHLRQLLSTA
jgi:formylmethanofuran--tetrahydromethanopterin N-formyltransferase